MRVAGKVPGILYGADKPAVPIELDHQALSRHLKMEAFHASILDMSLEGAKQQVLLRDVQMHPFRQIVLHVDFQRVDKSKKIHMKVPLHFINAEICPGVKIGGGIVNHVFNELEIQCLPDDLPEFITVDLAKLDIGHSMHINEVAMPKGVEPIPRIKKDNPAIVTVQVPRAVVEAEETAAAPTTEITGQAPVDAAAAKEGEERNRLLQFGRLFRLRWIDRHARTSLMASACGSAIGIGRPWNAAHQSDQADRLALAQCHDLGRVQRQRRNVAQRAGAGPQPVLRSRRVLGDAQGAAVQQADTIVDGDRGGHFAADHQNGRSGPFLIIAQDSGDQVFGFHPQAHGRLIQEKNSIAKKT